MSDEDKEKKMIVTIARTNDEKYPGWYWFIKIPSLGVVSCFYEERYHTSHAALHAAANWLGKSDIPEMLR